MKKVTFIVFALSLFLAPSLALASPSSNYGSGYSKDRGSYHFCFTKACKKAKKHHSFKGKKDRGEVAPTPTAVPEINAGGTAMALALLAGLILVGRERRRNNMA